MLDLRRAKLVKPVIFLQIPVSELLETIRHFLANGKEVREGFHSTEMRAIDCDSPLKSSQNLPSAQ